MRTARKRSIVAGSLIAVAALAAACSSSSPKPGQTPASTGHAGAGSSSNAPASSAGAASSPTSSPVAVGPGGAPVPARFAPASTSFVSASLGWVLGTVGCSSQPCTSILRTRDGGQSWQGVPAPRAPVLGTQGGPAPAGSIRTIRFADQADGWVAGRALYAT